MGPSCYIEYRGLRNRTIKGFYCTTEIIIIIEWNVLFVENDIFADFFDGSRISDGQHVNNTENTMSSTDIFISN